MTNSNATTNYVLIGYDSYQEVYETFAESTDFDALLQYAEELKEKMEAGELFGYDSDNELQPVEFLEIYPDEERDMDEYDILWSSYSGLSPEMEAESVLIMFGGDKNKAAAAIVVDFFEELLEEHGIMIPDECREGDKGEACLFGDTYWTLIENIEDTLSAIYGE